MQVTSRGASNSSTTAAILPPNTFSGKFRSRPIAARSTFIRTEGELIAKTLAGDVLLKGCAASSIAVQIVRGETSVTGCTVQGVQVSAGTGDISIGQVKAGTRYGNIVLNRINS